MKTPTHAAVALGAHTLWLDSGRAEGRDLDNWLAAEHALASAPDETPAPVTPSDHAKPPAHIPGETPSDHAHSELAAPQRQEARAPIAPHKSAPHAKPPESGKPLWNQPHSR